MVVVAALAGNIKFSLRYLPPINEMPPFELGNPREGRNWFGQGDWAFAGYAWLLRSHLPFSLNVFGHLDFFPLKPDNLFCWQGRGESGQPYQANIK
jgi:hypothetical protein